MRLQDIELNLQATRNRAIRDAAKRQLREDGEIDISTLYEEVVKDDDAFVDAMLTFIEKHVDMIIDPVWDEVERERADEEDIYQTQRADLQRDINALANN